MPSGAKQIVFIRALSWLFWQRASPQLGSRAEWIPRRKRLLFSSIVHIRNRSSQICDPPRNLISRLVDAGTEHKTLGELTHANRGIQRLTGTATEKGGR